MCSRPYGMTRTFSAHPFRSGKSWILTCPSTPLPRGPQGKTREYWPSLKVTPISQRRSSIFRAFTLFVLCRWLLNMSAYYKGVCVGQFPQRDDFMLHLPTCWYLKSLADPMQPPIYPMRPPIHPTRSPIYPTRPQRKEVDHRLVGSPCIGAHVSHVNFMLFVSISWSAVFSGIWALYLTKSCNHTSETDYHHYFFFEKYWTIWPLCFSLVPFNVGGTRCCSRVAYNLELAVVAVVGSYLSFLNLREASRLSLSPFTDTQSDVWLDLWLIPDIITGCVSTRICLCNLGN